MSLSYLMLRGLQDYGVVDSMFLVFFSSLFHVNWAPIVEDILPDLAANLYRVPRGLVIV